MKFIGTVIRYAAEGIHRFRHQKILRNFSTFSPDDHFNKGRYDSLLNSNEENEDRIFSRNSWNAADDSFYQKLERLTKPKESAGEKKGGVFDGFDESVSTTLSDGMENKLKEVASYFKFNPDEIINDGDNYSFRPDVRFHSGNTYDTKDLDLTRPAVQKAPRRREFKVKTKEVMAKADFRNVRFLANFVTVSGIITKRSKTGISGRAQRKVAREIKTARAFGLMPFTTMGTKPFVFGNSMEMVKGGDIVHHTSLYARPQTPRQDDPLF